MWNGYDDSCYNPCGDRSREEDVCGPETWQRFRIYDEIRKKEMDEDKKDTLMNVLLKYIPVTAIVLYTSLDSVLRAAIPVSVALWVVCFFILLIGAFLITYWITQGPEVDTPAITQGKEALEKVVKEWQKVISDQRIKQSFIAVIAFAGYVMCIGGPFAKLDWWQAYYGSVALVMAVLFSAMIAHKDLLAES